MQLIYVPDAHEIILSDKNGTTISILTTANLDDTPVHALGKAMAMAPSLVTVLDTLMDIEADDYGDRTISAEGFLPIHDALSGFTMADLIALTHFLYLTK